MVALPCLAKVCSDGYGVSPLCPREPSQNVACLDMGSWRGQQGGYIYIAGPGTYSSVWERVMLSI